MRITKVDNNFNIYRIGIGNHPTGGLFLRIDYGKSGLRVTK